MSHRKKQIESALKRTIANVLDRRLQDPRVSGLVSITRIELSPDRRAASVYVSVMPDRFEKRTLHGLNAAAGHIQSKAAGAMSLRAMPSLQFRLDSSLKRESHVLGAIKEAVAEDRRVAEQRDAGEAAPGASSTGEQGGPEEVPT